MALATMSDHDLVATVGASWRKNNGRACRGVSWKYPLRFLQLLAVRSGEALVAARKSS